MNYKMYDEMMEQPDSLRRTFASEMSKMDSVSEAVSKADKIYLVVAVLFLHVIVLGMH